MSKKNDLILKTSTVPGPTVLVIGELSPEFEELGAIMTVSYSDAKDNEETEISLTRKGIDKVLRTRGRDKSELKRYMI